MSGGLRRALASAAYVRGDRDADHRGTLAEAVARMLELPAVVAPDPDAIILTHTLLGQPHIRLRGALAEAAAARGIEAGSVHVSFSHDGGVRAALAAAGPGLCGAGLDLVHLPRLRRRPPDHLLGLARRTMAPAELDAFARDAAEMEPGALAERFAAHFSLMEAASKALGTGLRLGFGNGSSASLLPRTIAVWPGPPVRIALTGEALERAGALGAVRAAGTIVVEGEHLRTEVFLWGRPGE